MLIFQLFDNDGICKFPYAIRTERLSEGIDVLFRYFNEVPPDYIFRKPDSTKYGGGKISEPDEYKEHYNELSIQLVKDFCNRELKVLGYDFDGPVDDRVILNLKNIRYDIIIDSMDILSDVNNKYVHI